MKNLPLVLIGGGILFFLMSSKKTSSKSDKIGEVIPKPDDKSISLKGAVINCSQFKITNKKEFKKSLQEISLAIYKTKTTNSDEEDVTFYDGPLIQSILKFISPSCFKIFYDFALNLDSKDIGLSDKEKDILSLIFGQIIQNYAEAIIPELEKKKIPWDKYLTENVYSLQANHFLPLLNMELHEYNDLAKEFDSTLEYPFPKKP